MKKNPLFLVLITPTLFISGAFALRLARL
ncbi:hypothetical protein EC538_06620 [Helicobacter pylori]|nr:hypothetical protein EC538_06620 [Helicobacter pylori]